MFEAIWILLGLVGLAFGSDVVVGGARAVARRLGVSSLVIGLTITSIGTSIPEIATNVGAALYGRGGTETSGIAVGNIVGSCFGQITLLLGISAAFTTLHAPDGALRRDGMALGGATVVMIAACLDGVVSRYEGGLLAVAYVAYLLLVYVQERGDRGGIAVDVADEGQAPPEGRLHVDLGKVVGGIALVLIAANLVVGQGAELARELGMSELWIGLVVGLGTGLPELTVSVQAARSTDGALSLGNLMGSNITDPLFSFGLGAAIYPVTVSASALSFDLPFWGAATLIALLMLLDHRDLNRLEAGVLFTLFALYLVLRVSLGIG